MATRLNKTVVLVGMMGCGKTAVGTALAKRLEVPFLDSDDAIEAAAARSVAEIFARDGEAFFRQKETQVIGRLLDGEPCILSTGGGAWMSSDTREAVKARGVSVWLDAGLDLLWARVRHKDTRPLLRNADPYGTLSGLLKLRGPIYAEADLRVESLPDLAIGDMAERVEAALATRPDVLTAV